MLRRRPADALLLLLAVLLVAGVLVTVIALRQVVSGDALRAVPAGLLPAAIDR